MNKKLFAIVAFIASAGVLIYGYTQNFYMGGGASLLSAQSPAVEEKNEEVITPALFKEQSEGYTLKLDENGQVVER